MRYAGGFESELAGRAGAGGARRVRAAVPCPLVRVSWTRGDRIVLRSRGGPATRDGGRDRPRRAGLFLDTGQHFAETLDSPASLRGGSACGTSSTSRRVRRRLRRPIRAASSMLFDPDACCALRKVAPLDGVLRGFDVWVTGRKQYQSTSRGALPLIELVDGRLKINPIANWTAARVEAELARRDPPRHPLAARGYRSIGCGPCTRPVRDGEDAEPGAGPVRARPNAGSTGPDRAGPAFGWKGLPSEALQLALCPSDRLGSIVRFVVAPASRCGSRDCRSARRCRATPRTR